MERHDLATAYPAAVNPRSRALLPAVLASLGLAVLLLLVNLVAKLADLSPYPAQTSRNPLPFFALTGNTFYGVEPFLAGRNGLNLLGTLVAFVMLVVVGGVLVWLGTRTLTSQNGPLAYFLATWMALVVTCAVTGVISTVVRSLAFLEYLIGNQVYGSFLGGIQCGMKWGWLAAGAATLLWLATRAKSTDIGLRAS